MTTLIFHKDYLETDDGGRYVCSREQAKAILGRKRSYKQDTPLAGDEAHSDKEAYRIARKNGDITIGCKSFSKHEIAKVKKWLAGKKHSLANTQGD